MEGNTATVLHMGQSVRIAEDNLHKGDILLLQAGDLVPADLRLIEARGLEVDEWDLTGEIAPVEKRVDGDEVFLYKGSRVAKGSGRGVVVATGEETEYARVLKQPWGKEKCRFPSLMKWKHCILLICLLPPLVALLSQYRNDVLICLFGLLFAATTVLLQNGDLWRCILTSREATKLEAHDIHIHDMTSLHVISGVDLVCLDKTGVMTTREIQVRAIRFPGETPGAASILAHDERGVLIGIACALYNDVFFLERRDQATPMDRALTSFARQHGYDMSELAAKYKRVYDKPFDSEDRYMVAGFETGAQKLYFAKGDPETVVRMCTTHVTASGVEKQMDMDFLAGIAAAIHSASQEGDVTIALAYGAGSAIPSQHYAFLCLVQLRNPLSPEVPGIVSKLEEMGIGTMILIGDRAETARAIARQAGIGPDRAYLLTGKQMAQMSFSEIARQTAFVSIFARLLPSQKGILIRVLQERGNCVAMVGDGANDTIALKTADVGLSFVEGSSPLAKRVSKILIDDEDDVLSIVTSAEQVEWRLRRLLLFRVCILISMLSGLYVWMLR